MNAVRGRVRGGHVELEAKLPEGAEVVVLASDGEAPFDLDDPALEELAERMRAADRGELEPAATVLDRVRRARAR